jgi:hypothetical protein
MTTPDPLCPTYEVGQWHYDKCDTCIQYKKIREDERNRIKNER